MASLIAQPISRYFRLVRPCAAGERAVGSAGRPKLSWAESRAAESKNTFSIEQIAINSGSDLRKVTWQCQIGSVHGQLLDERDGCMLFEWLAWAGTLALLISEHSARVATQIHFLQSASKARSTVWLCLWCSVFTWTELPSRSQFTDGLKEWHISTFGQKLLSQVLQFSVWFYTIYSYRYISKSHSSDRIHLGGIPTITSTFDIANNLLKMIFKIFFFGWNVLCLLTVAFPQSGRDPDPLTWVWCQIKNRTWIRSLWHVYGVLSNHNFCKFSDVFRCMLLCMTHSSQ